MRGFSEYQTVTFINIQNDIDVREIKDKLSVEEMEQVVGGKSVFDNFEKRKVSGLKTGWLALRNDTAYDPKNEIGQLYNGDEVQVYYECTRNGYTWVYFPKLNKSGWVNSNFVKYED